MNPETYDALLDAAEQGVQFDGMYVHYGHEDYDHDEPSYTFGTPYGERTDLTESEFATAAEANEVYVSNWYFWHHAVGGTTRMGHTELDAPDDHRRAFLRWLEGAAETPVPERYDALADGISREWGELSITATLTDADGDSEKAGTRRYEIRHVDDADVSAADLDRYTDPLAARELGTYDERGRYRPLRTAPTLPSGWVIEDLDQHEVAEAVDAFYPATIANWHLEREGELDVSHWDETADRQTGIYAVIDELDEAAVNRIAASCCVDSQCLKRRQWDKDGETELDPDRGDGVFPCREPCSVVIAAARKWATLEREETETYEFDLTPSEKAQVEEIIDAVADGRVDEIREADVSDGANRYRARYLRAKRFDEGGNLSRTPTEMNDDAGGDDANDVDDTADNDDNDE